MYAVACTIDAPMHLRDFVRHAEQDYGRDLTQPTANAVIAPDARFCWAGKGLYGLFRHGPLPGPRNIEEAARLVLCASGKALSHSAIEYVLKRRFNYRFASPSFYNAMRQSPVIEWRWEDDGLLQVRRNQDSELQLRRDIPVVPARHRSDWLLLREHIEIAVEQALSERAKLLRFDRSAIVPSEWEP